MNTNGVPWGQCVGTGANMVALGHPVCVHIYTGFGDILYPSIFDYEAGLTLI